MSTARRRGGPGFGHDGGSNLADYLSATERPHQIELEMDPGERLVEIPVDLVDRSRFQARAKFDEEEITALGKDIQEHGLNHPVTVREGSGGRYELVAGERRWLAAKQAGLPHILARVRPLDDFAAHLVGVSENNRRANLSPWEMSLEAARLLVHAKVADRPHSQRDLAHYLNRNVSAVNQQLSIAAALTPDYLERTQVSEAMLCQLPHVTLRRIAGLPEERRGRALKEAIRMQQLRASGANEESPASPEAVPRPAKASPPDRWEQLWDRGGFRLQIKMPLRDLDPARAADYIDELVPAMAGLAARVAQRDPAEAVIRCEHARGDLIFMRPPNQMSPEERANASLTFTTLLHSLATPSQTAAPWGDRLDPDQRAFVDEENPPAAESSRPATDFARRPDR